MIITHTIVHLHKTLSKLKNFTTKQEIAEHQKTVAESSGDKFDAHGDV